MAVNGVSNMINNKFRLTGMASGLDTDTIIKNLMKTERVPLDKVMQKKQLAEWKRDDYREITNLLRGLKDEFFDVIKPSSNMLSQSSYKKFAVSSTDSTVVTAKGEAMASVGTHKVTVTNLATAATVKSGDGVTKALQSSDAVTTGAGGDVVNASGKNIKITLDGVTKEITLGSFTNTSTVADLALDIQNKAGAEFGAGKVAVGVADGNKLVFSTAGGASKLTIGNGSTNDGLGYLKVESGSTNRIKTTDTIEGLMNKLKTSFTYKAGTDNVEFTINSKTFAFSKDTTLSSMMNTINSDDTAKVNMAYDEVGDRFVITSKQTGTGNSIHISEGSSTFLSSAGLKGFTGSQAAALSYTNEKFNISIDGVLKEFTLDGTYADHAGLAADLQSKIRSEFAGKNVTVSANADNTLSFSLDGSGSTLMVGVANPNTSTLGLKNANYSFGEDAQFILDGQNVTRSSNSFTSNGVTYTLLKESATEQTISLSQDVNGVYDNIKKFVDKYNEVIDKINDKTSEKYDRDYQPLTDEQKEAMSDEDIEKWEKKAKTGLLRNDSTLENIVNNMRTALFEGVDGVETTLSSIGINTGTYSDKGKLFIDEAKLKEAITKDADGVMNLFAKESSSEASYSRNLTSDQRKTRYKEEGLANRLFDVIEDNISTYRDSNNKKGILLQTAGITGDISEFSNAIYDQIKGYNTKISEFVDKLSDKETRYYEKYARLEQVMSQMNSQSSWLSSQLGQGS